MGLYLALASGACGGDDERTADAASGADAPAADAGGADGAAADAAPPDASGADAGAKVADEVLSGLGPAALDGAVNARTWARLASAPQVFFTAYLPIYQADQLVAQSETCPAVVIENNVRTYTGGCTTSTGEPWFGTATVIGPVVYGIPGTVTYEGFGHGGMVQCGGAAHATETRYTGSVRRGSAGPAVPVVVDLGLAVERVDAACATEQTSLGYDYAMTVDTSGDADMSGTPDRRTWVGSGRVGKNGGEHAGLVTASTASEVTGEACGPEALSGTTTIAAGGHTLGIGYDGLTDCENGSTVQWSYDGADQGELTGVNCRAAAGRRGGAGAVGLGLGLGLGLWGLGLALATRRRRRGRAPRP
jgi:hypothetical protein